MRPCQHINMSGDRHLRIVPNAVEPSKDDWLAVDRGEVLLDALPQFLLGGDADAPEEGPGHSIELT